MDSAVVAGCWALNLKQKKRRQHTHHHPIAKAPGAPKRAPFIHSFTIHSHKNAHKRTHRRTLTRAHSHARMRTFMRTQHTESGAAHKPHRRVAVQGCAQVQGAQCLQSQTCPRYKGFGFRIQGSGLRVNAECLAGRTGPWCLSVFLDVSCFRLPRACTLTSLLCN